MMANTRQLAKNLKCLFKDIVDKYPESQLVPCKTDSRTWKHASSPAVGKINKLIKYFPELSLSIDSLEWKKFVYNVKIIYQINIIYIVRLLGGYSGMFSQTSLNQIY